MNDQGETKTLLQLIQEKNRAQGKPPALRADLRFGTGPDTRIFLLNKHDGTIRLLVGTDNLIQEAPTQSASTAISLRSAVAVALLILLFGFILARRAHKKV